MPKAEDITGQKFGKLTAIKKEPSKSGKTYWLFKCDCGNEKVIQTSHVKSGAIISCGCVRKDYSLNPNYAQLNKIRKCEICGKDFIISGFQQNTRKYCYDCSPKDNHSPTFRARAMKEQVVKLRGGKCERCGYDKCLDALEFHHTDPSTKDFKLANTGATPSYKKFLEETNKCILLCANCHREEHWRLRQEKKEKNE